MLESEYGEFDERIFYIQWRVVPVAGSPGRVNIIQGMPPLSNKPGVVLPGFALVNDQGDGEVQVILNVNPRSWIIEPLRPVDGAKGFIGV